MSEKIWSRNVLVLAQGHLSVNRNKALGMMAYIGLLLQHMQRISVSINRLLVWVLIDGIVILPHTVAP